MKRAGFTVGKYLVVSMFNNELVKFLGIAVITTVNRQMTLLE
jgi:hypothetical protein